jgi:hypothetical protein
MPGYQPTNQLDAERMQIGILERIEELLVKIETKGADMNGLPGTHEHEDAEKRPLPEAAAAVAEAAENVTVVAKQAGDLLGVIASVINGIAQGDVVEIKPWANVAPKWAIEIRIK